jgi:hypothetical protein
MSLSHSLFFQTHVIYFSSQDVTVTLENQWSFCPYENFIEGIYKIFEFASEVFKSLFYCFVLIFFIWVNVWLCYLIWSEFPVLNSSSSFASTSRRDCGHVPHIQSNKPQEHLSIAPIQRNLHKALEPTE